jgi:hypothetical protein
MYNYDYNYVSMCIYVKLCTYVHMYRRSVAAEIGSPLGGSYRQTYIHKNITCEMYSCVCLCQCMKLDF